jgi:hypothetical protein
MDNLVSILKVPVLNYDVKNKVLRLIQNWAAAFEGKSNLGYVGEVYRTLRSEGTLFHVLIRLSPFLRVFRIQLPTARPSFNYICDG